MKVRPSSRWVASMASTAWAIDPAQLQHVVDTIASAEVSSSDVAPAAADSGAGVMSGGIAVVPIRGPIFPRANWLTSFFGLPTCDRIAAAVRAAAAMPAVSAIVLDVDSPGGQVAGVPEAADAVYQARDAKPVIAVANHQMTSAAYWIGSAASEVVAAPSAIVGSIGVIAARADYSKALEMAGIRVHVISAGKLKAATAPETPATDEALAAMQGMIDEVYDRFVSAVARNRGVKASQVRSGYGEGFVLDANAAKREGMIDRVATFDDVVARLMKRRGNSARAVAHAIQLSAAADPARA